MLEVDPHSIVTALRSRGLTREVMLKPTTEGCLVGSAFSGGKELCSNLQLDVFLASSGLMRAVEACQEIKKAGQAGRVIIGYNALRKHGESRLSESKSSLMLVKWIRISPRCFAPASQQQRPFGTR